MLFWFVLFRHLIRINKYFDITISDILLFPYNNIFFTVLTTINNFVFGNLIGRTGWIGTCLFDYYKLSDGLVIATNKNRQIIRIIIDGESDSSIKTSKGINLESSVDDVIKAYGENYYKRKDDSGVPVIGYVDKKSKVTLEFFNYKNKVTMIRYDISSMQ